MVSQCVLRIDLEPFETTLEHIEMYSDMIVSEPKRWKVSLNILTGGTSFQDSLVLA